MTGTRLAPLAAALLLVVLLVTSFAPLGLADTGGTTEIVVEARQFSYNPPVIQVAKGARVRLTLRSMDVTHGLYLDNYGIEVKALPGRPAELEFIANKSGQFRFRCTQTCGPLHPFMVGKLIVEPNLPFSGALALTALVSLGVLGFLWLKREPALASVDYPKTPDHTLARFAGGGPAASPSALAVSANPIRLDLLEVPIIGPLLRWRGFQFGLMLPLLLVLMVALVAALRGSPVGSHNLSIVFVWILWWPILIILLVPAGGRVWCTLCPVPAPGEWAQRLSFIRRRPGRLFSLARKWPRKLSNMWLQNVAFLLIALFSAVILTTPLATAVVLASFFAGALVLSLVFQGRTFCRYVCPLGGFIGLCSMVAPFAVRVKDKAVCREHKGKECIRGSSEGYGCPWFEYPGTMDRNAYCGLCMECVKTCPKGNIAVGFQPVGHDLVVTSGRSDEAFRTFIALGSAALYSAVMLGPWGWLKSLAGSPLSPGFATYGGLLLGVCVVIVPGLFFATSWLSRLAAGRNELSVKLLWQRISYGLVPLALAAWISFSLALVLVSGYHVVPVLSDPLGHGWNLFGTATFEGAPVLMAVLPYAQAAVLLGGLLWSLSASWRLVHRSFTARRMALRGFLPVAVFLFGTTATFLWLHLG